MSVDVSVTLICDGQGNFLPCPGRRFYTSVSNSISAVSDARQRAFDQDWGRRTIKDDGLRTVIADMCPDCNRAHQLALAEKRRGTVLADVEW